VHRLMVQEIFIIGQHILNTPGKSGYDEAHELASKVMDLKLSIASIQKQKKTLNLNFGDE